MTTCKRTALTAEEIRNVEEFPSAIESYAAGYQAGRLHSLARMADCMIWASDTGYAHGYRNGWRVEGRPT